MRSLHFISIATALLESLLMAGNFYGWPSLQYVLTKEGYFLNQCSKFNLTNATTILNRPENGKKLLTCPEAEESFNLVFQLSLVFLNVLGIVFGYLLDRYGTWIARSAGCSFLFAGYMLLCVANPTKSWILYPAMVGISSGGLILLVTNTQLGNLIHQHRSLYITVLNGLFDSGAVVYLVFKLTYDRGLEPKVFYAIMTGLAGLTTLRTFLLMPKSAISYPMLDQNVSFGIDECTKRKKAKPRCGDTADNQPLEETENQVLQETDFATNQDLDAKSLKKDNICNDNRSKVATFKSCLFSKLYLAHVMFYSACYVRYVFVLGSVIAWLSSFQNTHAVSFYTEVLGYMLTGGAIAAPINGMIADAVMKFYRTRLDNQRLVILRGLMAQVTLTALLQILLSSVVLAKELYLSFILLLFFRAFLFGTAFNFIAQAFPIEHFGKLMGVTQALGGVASIFQYGLFKIAAEVKNGFTVVNIYLLLVSVLCFAHPIFLYFKAFRVDTSQTFCSSRKLKSVDS